MAGEKGSAWTRLRVKGTPGHGSMPLHADNAAVKAGAVLGRIAAYRPPARIHDLWRRFIDGLGLTVAQRFALTHTQTLDLAVGRLPLAPAAVRLLGERRSRELALTGGEDYELLFTFDPRLVDELASALAIDGGLTVLGEVTDRVPTGTVQFVEAGQPIELAQKGYVAF